MQAYFWNKLEDDPNCAKHLHLFNSLNHKTYNDQTLKLWMSNDPAIQIIIVTSILSVGIDTPTFDDVIVYGEPLNTDELLQDYG